MFLLQQRKFSQKRKKSSFMRIFLKFHKETEKCGVHMGDCVRKNSFQ